MDMQLEIEEHTATDAWPSFTIKVADFHKAISVVKGAVERTTLVPILTHALIEARDGRLQLTCTDMEISLTKTIAANVRVPGVMAVPAAWLSDTLSRLPQDGVADIVTQERSVSIKVGKSKAAAPTEDPLLYPSVGAASFSAKIELASSVFSGAIAHVDYCMSKNLTRYYLCGIFMHTPGPHDLRICAADGVALAEVRMKIQENSIPPIILPPKAVALMKSCLSDAAGSVQMEISDTRARLTFGDLVMMTKLVDATYPDYGRVIPDRIDTPLVVSAKPLMQATRLVANAADDKEFGVIFDTADGVLTLSSMASGRGSATSELGAGDVNYDGERMEFAVNGNELSAALAVLAGDAEFHYVEDRTSIMVSDTKDEGFVFVLGRLRY
jgi:DNA polymerase III subunit beta